MVEIVFAHTDDKLSDLYRHKLHPDYRVHTAGDGITALRKVRNIKPRLVVSDIKLPLLSGLSLLKYIRKHPELKSMTFIFLSAAPLHEDALSFGANEWIHQHSSTVDEITDKILRHINTKTL